MTINVLLLGCGGNAGINYVKSLRMTSEKYYIVGCDLDVYNLVSSNCDKKILLSIDNMEEKKKNVLKIIKEEKIDYIHPQPDMEVKFLIENKVLYGKYTFNHDLDIWNKMADKLYCQHVWNKDLNLGFSSYSIKEVIKNPKLFDELIANSGKAWIRAIRGAGSKAALPIKTFDIAMSWAKYWVEMKGMSMDDFMLAEYLNGNEYAVQTFWIDGELIQSQARQRMVYFFHAIMPSGQSSTPAVAKIVNERDVYDTAYNAIKAIDKKPHGIYCVDLKRNSKNIVVPMEINYGRLFTTSDFFAKLGVNTPFAMVNYFMNKKKDFAVEKVKEEYIWIRGIDKEPFLYKK